MGFVLDVVKVCRIEEDLDVLLASVLVLSKICQDSKPRMEQAVLAGVVPILIPHLNEPGRFGSLATGLICDFARASAACRSIMHKCMVFEKLLKIDPMPSQVFEAIAHWISVDPNRCKVLLNECKNNSKVSY